MNRSPTSQSRHQHISSPTSVTNIDLKRLKSYISGLIFSANKILNSNQAQEDHCDVAIFQNYQGKLLNRVCGSLMSGIQVKIWKEEKLKIAFFGAVLHI